MEGETQLSSVKHATVEDVLSLAQRWMSRLLVTISNEDGDGAETEKNAGSAIPNVTKRLDK
jgi:hypothetical protein